MDFRKTWIEDGSRPRIEPRHFWCIWIYCILKNVVAKSDYRGLNVVDLESQDTQNHILMPIVATSSTNANKQILAC